MRQQSRVCSVADSESVEYPGETATAVATLRMADHYRRAAHELLAPGRRSDPLAQAPGRLLAVHAIELYLNAWLADAGETGRGIRSRQHDLSGRARTALAGGLGLRHRTVCHLARITEEREYLVVRYDPEGIRSVSQINRLIATLDELAHKVRDCHARRAAPSGPPCGVSPAAAALPPVWQTPAAATLQLG